MVKTRRSVNGEVDERNYRKRTLSKDDDEQDETVDGWSPRELRSHYSVTRKRQHWPTKLVTGGRLRTIKMPRIIYPESEDTEPDKFSRRRRPMRVFFQDTARVRRSSRPRRSEAADRQLRPLRPNNYMEDSDKPMQETERHVRRSGRQRKLIHHTFNESWITNELKVKGYPKLWNNRTPTSSDCSSDEERLRDKQNKQMNGIEQSEEDHQNNKRKRTLSYSTRQSIKKDEKSDGEREQVMDSFCENGETNIDSDKSGDDQSKVAKNESEDNNKEQSDRGSNENEVLSRIVGNRSLRLRRGKNGDTTVGENNPNHRRRAPKKEDPDLNSNSQIETGTESDNSSDSGSDIVVRGQLRRSNRTRKPRNAYIESQNCKTNQYTRRKKPYTLRKTYSLRERKQPKIIVRSQSPTTTSGSSSSSDTEEELNVSVKNKTKARQKSKTLGDHTDRALRDIQPVELDGSVRFSSVGGLEGHIRCLREMVLFPLMYPQLFEKFRSRPPKGVLFHGPPGTGKTLLARALANECSIQGGQKVSFFMRKGADCLKKWVGESERNIKLLFQQANKMKPSIIFFDEIDALAPVRSVRQEQVHTSVVGTLLAEMDGLCDRGEVVVIGATNRLDAVDPALRRAGRFDRELHFPPPPCEQRAAILRVLTAAWQPPPAAATVGHIATLTTGYGGSDLKALCSESVLRALERTYPQVYKTQHALLIDPQKVEVRCEDLVSAMRGLVAAGSRCAPPPARPLPAHLLPLLGSTVDAARSVAVRTFPLAEKATEESTGDCCPSEMRTRSWSAVMLISGPCAASHVAPALLAAMEHCPVKEVSLAILHQGVCLTPEQTLLSIFSEVRRSAAEGGVVVYAPGMEVLCGLLGDSGMALLTQLWQDLAAAVPTCLLLATCESPHTLLPPQVKGLFPFYKDCIFNIKEPSSKDVSDFLRPIFLEKALEPPIVSKNLSLPELPKAPPPPAPRPTPVEQRRAARKEAHLLRELRIFLRDVCRKLAANRRFYKFTKPVDLEEVTDYLDIIKQPMDLETMMTKVDMHRYNCARDFLQDIDLICANALEYNPDRTSSDKQIRHEACSLRDHAHALVEVEMDSDFEEECRAVAATRAAHSPRADHDLPSFIYTANHIRASTHPRLSVQHCDFFIQPLKKYVFPIVDNGALSTTSCHTVSPPQTNGVTADSGDGSVVADPADPCSSNTADLLLSNARKRKKRKKASLWSKGIAKKQKTSAGHKDTNNPIITDEESKENKPLCSSPVSLDKSADLVPSTPHKASPTHSSPPVPEGSLVKKLQLHDTEMIFDTHTLDLDTETNILDSNFSPSRQGDRRASTVLTSTPQRKKSSNQEHSKQVYDDEKLTINKEELENIMSKSIKAVKGIGLKSLIDLYCQLDRVLSKYSAQHDRSNLPAELQTTVTNFVKISSQK